MLLSPGLVLVFILILLILAAIAGSGIRVGSLVGGHCGHLRLVLLVEGWKCLVKS